MSPGILQIVIRSVSFYKKQIVFQLLILILLSAVITGALLTGVSVKNSLRRVSAQRLGNTGYLVSSGERYIHPDLSLRLNEKKGLNTNGLLEITGMCQGLSNQKIAANIHIFAVNDDFFEFHGFDSLKIEPGKVAINRKLAEYLGIMPDDDIIIRFRRLSNIPSDAPFAPAGDESTSVVLKTGKILDESQAGNFSLSISQIVPMNIFINLTDLTDITGQVFKNNRLLIEYTDGVSKDNIESDLQELLRPSDIGFSVRQTKLTGGCEMISDRVFIDQPALDAITGIIPNAAPVITYMGNKIKKGSGYTPYSFVAALPGTLYPEAPEDNGIIINSWLADDLSVLKGDTIEMTWYSPDSLRNLKEISREFLVEGITGMPGKLSDSLLMPDFPGISGRESCSDWDAGVPISMNDIREKDEDYWTRFRGTPKAFINYDTGRKLWGGNFGPATALRFPSGSSEEMIYSSLAGSMNPYMFGLTLTDIAGDSLQAADESIDFSSLFLSLGFFLILSSIVFLTLAVSTWFDSKKVQVRTYFSLGFRISRIRSILMAESALISLAGCFSGALTGYLVNILIINALNNVWTGAVQTDTLIAYFRISTLITGFLATFIISLLVFHFKLQGYFISLRRKIQVNANDHFPQISLILLIISSMLFITLFSLSIHYNELSASLSFGAGAVLLITIIQLWRFIIFRNINSKRRRSYSPKTTSRYYYSFYPSHAITPILFIAAGIFAVFITSANRMNFNQEYARRSGGTGGYLLWCENTIPVKEDLNTPEGKKSLGLDEDMVSEMNFIQMKRSAGDDASCLNLNHVTAPPLLGLDPSDFITKGAFSFAKEINNNLIGNSWRLLDEEPGKNTVYGIADQTVLQWGLKIQPGDTIILRSESGQPLKIVIAAGLKSSVFQGYVLIGNKNFRKYFPSISGSSVFLVDGDPLKTEEYRQMLEERLNSYGIHIDKTTDRLASFYEVTNTYLSVFGVFGALGMITGIAGLGFVLLRTYNGRKKEFALMLATGFSVRKIKSMILREQFLILIAGVLTGVISALVATIPSIKGNSDIPWLSMAIMILAILSAGIVSLYYSVRSVTSIALKESLRKE